MPQRTLGRSCVQPGNVENTGAAPTHFKVSSVSQSHWLSRPRVLYIPFSVRTPLESTSSGLRRIMAFPQKTGEPVASDPVRLARSVLAQAAEAIKPGKTPKPTLSPD